MPASAACDINELRILHKPMGLREIMPALIEMITTAVTGLGWRRVLVEVPGISAAKRRGGRPPLTAR